MNLNKHNNSGAQNNQLLEIADMEQKQALKEKNSLKKTEYKLIFMSYPPLFDY